MNKVRNKVMNKVMPSAVAGTEGLWAMAQRGEPGLCSSGGHGVEGVRGGRRKPPGVVRLSKKEREKRHGQRVWETFTEGLHSVFSSILVILTRMGKVTLLIFLAGDGVF